MENAEQQALAQLRSIVEMVTALGAAGNDGEREAAQTRIEEDPLSVEIRSGWSQPGQPGTEPNEFRILLCTGGPAVRIIGELNEHGEPERAQIEHQDWFTPWQCLLGTSEEDSAALLEYCSQFYFV
jgi:hypothetical protein